MATPMVRREPAGGFGSDDRVTRGQHQTGTQASGRPETGGQAHDVSQVHSAPASGTAAVGADATALVHGWTEVAAALRADLGARTFDHWLKPVRVGSLCEMTGTLTLLATSRFSATWITDRFADRILLAWQQVLPAVRVLRIEAGKPSAAIEAATAAATLPLPPMVDQPAVVGTATDDMAAGAASATVAGLDARLTFDRFVVARSNILAANAARRMAAAEMPLFNPLYLRSGTGQGKTHLLHAMARAFLAERPTASVLVLSAERFMRDFVAAMRAGDTMAFKDRLRAIDFLLIDDLQFVIGKGSTQEELLHTIDDLLTSGKRIAVAADRPPHALDGIDARLLSRLAGGLVADIEAPEAGLREAVLRQRIAALPAVEVPEAVIDYLAARITRNIRELEGALNKLLAYAALTGVPITLALAEERLADMVRGAHRRVTIDEIQRAVCAHYRLDRAEMGSKRRVRTVVRPRQIAMYLAKELTPRSYPEIGRKFGGRDHSTVIHAVRAIESLRATDADIDADIAAIRRQLAV